MPLGKHFGGHGEKVMRAMRKTYGGEKAKRVFYATENKNKKRKFLLPSERIRGKK